MQCPYCDERVAVPAPVTTAAAAMPAPAAASKPWQKGDAPADSSNRQNTTGRSLEGRIFNGGVLGGLLAMLVALVWFIVGLAADRIFFYPPILFIIGLVAFIKGLVQNPE
jgi:hypothetical protein